MLRVRIAPASGKAFARALRGSAVLIGRSAGCDLVVPDPLVSRQHTRLFRTGNSWYAEDLGSRNGTLVNGKPARGPTPIVPGDRLLLGGTALEVLLGTRGDRASPTASTRRSSTIFRPARVLLDDPSLALSEPPDEISAHRRHTARLRLLHEVHQALAQSIELEDLLALILDRVCSELRPEEAAIFLRDGPEHYRRAAWRTRPGIAKVSPCSRTLLRKVVEEGQATLVLDVGSDSRLGDASSFIATGISSLIAAPLLDDRGSLGMIALASRAAGRRFDAEDLALLVSLASIAALRLRNIGLAADAAEHRHLEEEVRLAREIQLRLLPKCLPAVPGWEIFGGNVPSRGVSGDFYLTVLREEVGDCVLLVVDVAGKGLSAALVAASLEALVVGPINLGRPPEEICTQASQQLYLRTSPARYATAVVASLDPGTGRVVYTVAGHPPPLVVRADGGVERLVATGCPLGLLPGARYAAGEVVLAPGDTLVLYTDGLIETLDRNDTEFGIERLLEVCRNHRTAPLPELRAILEKNLAAFSGGEPPTDDRTLLLARKHPV